MNSAWRISLAAAAVVLLAGIGAGMIHIGGAVPGTPCTPLTRVDVAASGISFVNSFASSGERVNGILIRAEGGVQLECLQVLDRARCTTEGPKTIRVIAGDLIGYFSIADGQRATLKAAPDGIACGLEAT